MTAIPALFEAKQTLRGLVPDRKAYFPIPLSRCSSFFLILNINCAAFPNAVVHLVFLSLRIGAQQQNGNYGNRRAFALEQQETLEREAGRPEGWLTNMGWCSAARLVHAGSSSSSVACTCKRCRRRSIRTTARMHAGWEGGETGEPRQIGGHLQQAIGKPRERRGGI